MRMSRRDVLVLAGLTAAFVAVPGSTATGQDRGELIRQADEYYQNFQTEPALTNLRAALDPTRGQPDSLWNHGVHLLAQIYFEQGDTDQAVTWLRWAMRADPDIPLDAAKFLPAVLAMSNEAREWAIQTASEADGNTETRFEWPVGRMVPATGSLRIENAGLGVPIRILVQREGERQARGGVAEGLTAQLDPGTYEIQAAADGYLGARITRVVLPGVTTVLRFNLQPLSAVAPVAPAVLGADALSHVRGQMAKLSLWRGGRGPTCAGAVYVGSAYLVTTYEAIRGADSSVVFPPDGSRIENRVVRVAAVDSLRNLAVLKVPLHGDSLAVGEGVPEQGQQVWAAGFPECGDFTSTGVRVSEAGNPLVLAESVAGAQLGGAVVDADGTVLGLTFRGDRAVPASTIAAMVSDARERDAAGQLLTLATVAGVGGPAPTVATRAEAAPREEKKGGFPIAIVVVGGLAAAGGAAALLLMGGGDNGGPTPTPTGGGSIFISVPNR